ncbi:MAG TPA: VOC family protein [Acidimicrobiales bacterium]
MEAEPVGVSEIVVADDPAAWRDAGFSVTGPPGATVCRIGSVTVRLAGRRAPDDPGGIAAWVLRGGRAGHPPARDPLSLDGLVTSFTGPGAEAPPHRAGGPGIDRAPGAGSHPNGALRIDHVVIISPDLDRTTDAFAESAGVVPRRTREAGRRPDGGVTLQRFFRLGEVILELVGPAEPSGTGPARFWGLAHAVADLDRAAALLAGRISPVRDAVQPGRRIATLDVAGLSVPTALMSDPAG